MAVLGNRAQPLARDIIVFMVGGGVNTILTYVVFRCLEMFAHYHVAYAIAYATGVVFSYWYNARVVFRVPLRLSKFFAYPSVYLIQYGGAAFLLGFLVEYVGFSVKWAPLAVACASIPFTFLLSRWVLGGRCKMRMAGE